MLYMVPIVASAIFENSSDIIEFMKTNGIDVLENVSQLTQEGLLLFDQVADSRAIESIRILGAINSAYSGIRTVKERVFARNMTQFVHILQTERLDSEKLNQALAERLKAINNSDKKTLREVELLIVTLDRSDSEYKAKLFAKLYIELLKNNIRLDQFEDMRKIIENWFVSDEETLYTYYSKVHFDSNEHIKSNGFDSEYIKNSQYTLEYPRINRLVSFGLLQEKIFTEMVEKTIVDFFSSPYKRYCISVYGSIMCMLLNDENRECDWKEQYSGSRIVQMSRGVARLMPNSDMEEGV